MGHNPRVRKGEFPFLYNPGTQPLYNANGWPVIELSDARKASTPEFIAWYQSVKHQPFDYFCEVTK